MFRSRETSQSKFGPASRRHGSCRLPGQMLGALLLLAIAPAANAQPPGSQEFFEVVPARAAERANSYTDLASLETPTRLLLAGPRNRISSLRLTAGQATAMTVGPDGYDLFLEVHQGTSRVAAANTKNRIAVWTDERGSGDSASGNSNPAPPIFLGDDGSKPISSIAFDSTGESLFVARAGGRLSVINSGTGRTVHEHTLTAGYVTAATHDGTSGGFLFGVSNGNLLRWNVRDDPQIATIRTFPSRIAWLNLDTETRRLTVVDAGGGVHQASEVSGRLPADNSEWNVIAPLETSRDSGGDPLVSAVAPAGDQRIAIGLQTGEIAVLDVYESEAQILPAIDASAITGLAFDKDAGSLYSATEAGLLCQWSPARPLSPPLTLMPAREQRIWSVRTGRNRPLVAIGGDRGLVEIWNAEDGQLLHKLSGASRSIDELVLFNADQRLAACSHLDTAVVLWSTESGEMLGSIELPDKIRALLHHVPSGRLIAGCRDGSISIISSDFESIESLSTPESEELDPVSALASEPQSDQLAVARGAWTDQTVTSLTILEKAKDGGDWIETALELEDAHRDTIRSLVFNADGSRLYSLDQSGIVCVWSVSSRRLLRSADLGRKSRPMQLAPTEEWLLIGHHDGTITVLEREGLVIESRWNSGANVFGITVDRESRWAAIADGKRTVQFWPLPQATDAQRKSLLKAFPTALSTSIRESSADSGSSVGRTSP